ncbi:hypothetical protein [Spirosoma flavum]|uniref:Uncharacterized protein n=1 Tax=Spirosoma flavum TaxID=2048557 RepID=A0ABW6AQ69_9BACT
MNKPIPTQETYEEAKKNPGDWVYVIDPKYNGQENVPLKGIVGAWKVDYTGRLTGTFHFNQNYESKQEPISSKKRWWKF